MENFKNNYSEILLLSNKKITFERENEKFDMIPMSLSDILFNTSLGYLIGILDTDIEELKKQISGYNIKGHYEYFHLILTLGKKREEIRKVSKMLLEGLKTIIPEINFDDGVLKIKKIFVDKNLFSEIIRIIFAVLGREKTIILPEDDEFTRIEKEAKLRAERIRTKSKKNKEQNENENDDGLKNMLAAILYEFPQYQLKDLFELNIYTIHYLFGYVGKIANYEVSKIAAGNGLAKKHKYFIEK